MNLFERGRNSWTAQAGALCIAWGVIMLASGCEKKEKVLEIQTPGVNLEVNKTTSPTGDKGIEVKSHSNRVEIDATNKKSD